MKPASTKDCTGNQSKSQPPWEIQSHATEALVENVFSHTVALVAGLHKSRGSGIALRWKKYTLILTANHVISELTDDELHFAPRPPQPVHLNEPSKNEPYKHQMHKVIPLPLRERYCDVKKDLAALLVPPDLEVKTTVRFYELGPSEKLVQPMSISALAIGFPEDAVHMVGPKACAISGHVLFANQPVRQAGRLLREFKPKSQFLYRFSPASDGRDPHGFSGTGFWYQRPVNQGRIWHPQPALLGICLDYFRKSQLLSVLRVERIISFLNRALGSE